MSMNAIIPPLRMFLAQCLNISIVSELTSTLVAGPSWRTS